METMTKNESSNEIRKIRDKEIIAFVDMMGAATFSSIRTIFFCDKASRTAHQVMQRLCSDKYKELSTQRHYLVNEHIYWIPKKKPEQLKHAVLRTRFLEFMYNKFKVYRYQRELENFGGIRPDILISFETEKGTKYNGFLEVELNNNGTHFIDKYTEFYDKGIWRNYFATFPIVFTVTNKKKLKTDQHINLIVIDEEFQNFNEAIKIIE